MRRKEDRDYEGEVLGIMEMRLVVGTRTEVSGSEKESSFRGTSLKISAE